MRSFLIAMTSVLTFGCLVSESAAKPITYFCEIKSFSAGGWIPESGVYAVDTASKSVIVFDNFIRYANKEALVAEVDSFGDKFYKFHWSLKLRAKGNKNLTARYSARIHRETRKLTISAFVGDDRSHRGLGKCNVQ